jgi:hypothetical protein
MWAEERRESQGNKYIRTWNTFQSELTNYKARLKWPEQFVGGHGREHRFPIHQASDSVSKNI